MLAILSGMGSSWSINQWSAAYLRGRLNSELAREALPEPPEEHPHAAIWLAEDAFDRGDFDHSMDLLAPLVNSGNLLANSALGDIFQAQGNFISAIDAWERAGDYQSLVQAAEVTEMDGRLIDDAELAYRAAWEIDSAKGTLPYVEILLQKQDYAAAEAILQQAIQETSNSYLKYLWLRRMGDILQDDKRWDEAATVYNQNSIRKTSRLLVVYRFGMGIL